MCIYCTYTCHVGASGWIGQHGNKETGCDAHHHFSFSVWHIIRVAAFRVLLPTRTYTCIRPSTVVHKCSPRHTPHTSQHDGLAVPLVSYNLRSQQSFKNKSVHTSHRTAVFWSMIQVYKSTAVVYDTALTFIITNFPSSCFINSSAIMWMMPHMLLALRAIWPKHSHTQKSNTRAKKNKMKNPATRQLHTARME